MVKDLLGRSVLEQEWSGPAGRTGRVPARESEGKGPLARCGDWAAAPSRPGLFPAPSTPPPGPAQPFLLIPGE